MCDRAVKKQYEIDLPGFCKSDINYLNTLKWSFFLRNTCMSIMDDIISYIWNTLTSYGIVVSLQ